MDVALLKTTESHNQTMREYISHLVSQLEIFREVSKTHLERNQTAMKQRYDEVQYEVGDCVFIFFPKAQPGLSKKLQQLWCGNGPINYMVRNLENNKLLSSPIHVNRMKFAYDRFVRPSNETVPVELDARAPITELGDNDLSTDSFQPLTAKHSTENPVKIPGLPSTSGKHDLEYAVEKVIRGKFINGKLHYLIKWQNFHSKYKTLGTN